MNSVGGGAERVLAKIASEIAGRGHDVWLLSYDDLSGASFYPLHPSIRRVNLGFESQGRLSKKKFYQLRHLLIIRRVVVLLKPAAVVGFMHSAFIPLGLALLRSGTPVIASEHIVSEHYRSRPLQATLLRLSSFFVKATTCVSEQAKQTFSPFLQRKMVVVPNPLTFEKPGLADASGSGRTRKIVLAVGRLDYQKDHATLIDAFARIAKAFPDWDLTIIGEGILRPELEIRIRTMCLNGRIFLLGERKDIMPEYGKAQLFVQPSRYESFCLTVAEALSYGLPVIGFNNCTGVNQLICDGENGLLVDGTGDRTAALSRGLSKLMKDSQLRQRLAKGHTGTRDEHEINRVADAWIALLESHAVPHDA